MYTGEFVSWALKRQATGFTEPEAINLLNIVQNALYKYERPQSLYVDPATGRIPTLTTAANTIQYDGPDNTWRVSNVLFKWQANADFDYGYSDYGISDFGYVDAPPLNTREPININGNFYVPFPFVRCLDAVEGGVPQILFSRSVGSTSGIFFLESYMLPTQITSKNIQLTIPDSNGAHLKYVFPAYMKAFEAFNQGNIAEAMMYIEKVIAPQIWTIMAGGAQGKRHRVTNRPY